MTEKQKANDKDKKQPATAKNTTREERKFIEEHAEGLSKTTVRYAKWTHSVDEHEDKPGQTLATQSREVIQAWAEERGGRPATVGEREGERPRVLRFDFTDSDGEGSRLEEIDWEDWFGVFEERQLVFIYQEHKADGTQSNFFRLDSPEREDG